ncbi:hypothetical protein VNI00_015745 [Paramarasmius palmivorus]|uniref:AMP-dependent synthetase/ligase domain-containing protein n=1 Tax=Paramarasmius palmivorus TaxID=297713 RepID=A0AAW0BL14_9AGAR
MPPRFQTHLSNLERAVSLWPSATAFKIPIIDRSKVPDSPHISGYSVVTYTELYQDVLRFAEYWAWRLQKAGITPKSVVGFCSKGAQYTDMLHIYGLSRAGYVPQCFSLLPNAVELVISLLERSGAKALIYQEGYINPARLSTNASSGVKLFPSLSARDSYLRDSSWMLEGSTSILADMPIVSAEDTALIFHSTGTTSGVPKHVPYSYQYMDTLIQKLKFAFVPASPHVQDVNSWVGSICHMGQASYVMSGFYHGSCMIEQTTPFLSPGELKAMVNMGGLTRASMFPALLVKLFQDCRKYPESGLRDLLLNLDSIIYGGGSLPKDEIEWARNRRINLINVYASTECGVPILQSNGLRLCDEEEDYLRSIPVKKDDGSPLLSYRFDALPADENGMCLKELIVLSDSGDCPDKSFRSADGHFHTGDLFEEAKPGAFVFRGRSDDWIKMANACKCDARSIEDDVRQACADLIFDCVVVGTRRPSPALIVEPAVAEMSEESLRQEIFRRVVGLRSHNQRLPHERIASPDGVIVVPPRSLIRTATKGNVRRNAVEEAMNARLDSIFAI